MELKEMIYKRKSVRSYTGELVSDVTVHQIQKYISTLTPLHSDIHMDFKIVEKDRVKCMLPWIPPQLVAIFGENKEGIYENAGFLCQQLDLYLQSIGLGTCWLGLGKLSGRDLVDIQPNSNIKFIMLLAFGHPRDLKLRSDASEFNRKSLTQISDQPDERLEPARLAPSSVNSQPWYFTHEEDTIHTYCVNLGLLKSLALGNMNRIDMGIALAHMYVSNPETFRFFRSDSAASVKGYYYVGSFVI